MCRVKTSFSGFKCANQVRCCFGIGVMVGSQIAKHAVVSTVIRVFSRTAKPEESLPILNGYCARYRLHWLEPLSISFVGSALYGHRPHWNEM